MKLAQFIAISKDEILTQWDEFAGSLAGGSDMNRAELRDHAEQILLAIATDLSMSDHQIEESRHSRLHAAPHAARTASEGHATERLRGGFSLSEMISEYRALRVSVLQLWGATLTEWRRPEIEEVTRFNDAIDQSISEALLRFDTDIQESRLIFLGTLAFDLRNPLSAIEMWAQFMMQAKGLDQTLLKAATSIHASSLRLEHIVANLLDFTRAQLEPGIELSVVPLDFGAVCRQAADALRAYYPKRDVRFTSSGDLHGTADGIRISQVYSNLIGNALEHGSQTGPVDVSILAEEQNIIARIHNLGAPISPAKMPHLFDVTQHVATDNELGTNESRLGLGLYISRKIISAHGGEISVTSSDAEGTTFTVRCPRKVKPVTGRSRNLTP